MQKLQIKVIIALLCTGLLSGCGKSQNEEANVNQNSNSSSTETNQGQEQIEGLHIILNGENEATFTLNEERIGELDSCMQGDSEQILNEINIELTSEDKNHQVSIALQDNHFNIYASKTEEQQNVNLWDFSDYEIDAERTDKSFSVTISQLGIASVVKQCTNYAIRFCTIEPWNIETITEGNVSDILSIGESQSILQVVFPTDETVKLKLYGEEAKTAFYNNTDVNVRIYETEEQMKDVTDLGIAQFSLCALNTGLEHGAGEIYQIGNDGMYHNIDDIESSAHGTTIATNYGVAMKCSYSSIKELLPEDYYYKLYIGEEVVEQGMVGDVLTMEKYDIPPIPDVFPVNSKDSEYFTPETDNYVIAMATYPVVQIYDYGFSRGPYGNLVYAPMDGHLGAITVVALISYDEFGVINQKNKIIYDTDADAMTAVAYRLDWLEADTLTGDESTDSAVIAQFFDELDQKYFANLISEGRYDGHYGNVRYYEGDWGNGATAGFSGGVGISEDVKYDEQGFYKESIEYDYNYDDFSIGQSTIYTDTADFVQYESKPNIGESTPNYAEEKSNYNTNTAPSNWQDHPYAAYFPEIPDDIVVSYGEGTNVNDEKLLLGTDTNGCTKEQAESYLEAFRKMEYENEIVDRRYEEMNDDEYILIRYLEGDIRLLVSWRADLQSLTINADKN